MGAREARCTSAAEELARLEKLMPDSRHSIISTTVFNKHLEPVWFPLLNFS
jgi:hypothetical protein